MGMKIITCIAAVMCAVLLFGQVSIYLYDSEFDVNATFSSDGIEYSVSSTGTDIYTAVIMDSGVARPLDTLYVYYDANYVSNYERVKVAVGGKSLTQEYYIDQIIKELKNVRNFDSITVVNADELLKEILKNPNPEERIGVLMISGVMPNTVYDGTENSPILKWIDDGGYLYWVGNLIGSHYATKTELVPVEKYQELIFGQECINETDVDFSTSEIKTNEFVGALSLLNNHVKYGLNIDNLGNDALAIGYEEGGYSSISLVKRGNGMITVFGGEYSNEQRTDCAQIIASGITYSSEIKKVIEGSVKRNTITNKISIPSEINTVNMYTYLGGDFLIYGKQFVLSSGDSSK